MLFFEELNNRPNRLVEKQKAFQAATHLPVYMRGRYSKFLMSSYYLVFTVGVASTAYSAYQLVFSKPPTKA